MERREFRHDRHTVSLLMNHTVFSPKYRGKILVGDVALALDGIIRKTYKISKRISNLEGDRYGKIKYL